MFITTHFINHVATITLNRPDVRNALSRELIQALIGAVQAAEADAAVRVVVLQGAGAHFCAGADLEWMRASLTATSEMNWADAALIAQLMQVLHGCTKPLIARVHGSAIGGGVGVVACADIVVATDDAQFGLSEVKLGLIPSVIAPYVIAKIGASHARRYFMTGERITAAMACTLGLVHEYVPPAALDATVQSIAATILSGGPRAVVAAKAMVRELTPQVTPAVTHRTIETIAAIRVTPEAQEGMTAFFEKRQPNWHV